jgi:GT2 family glycosyltransferase
MELDVVLVDDGSTDGTTAAVREQYPSVILIEGDGTLYWNGGMRLALQRARELNPDYYLLLNDDTELYDDAIARLISEHRELRHLQECPIVVVGSTRDPDTKEITYGGWRVEKWWNPLHTEIVNPSDRPKQCDTFNANCALVGKEVVATVGNLDSAFTHGFGDFDYGFRLTACGGEVWLGSGFHGECIRDHGEHPWFDPERSWKERIDALREVKAEPLKERMIYASRHGGPLWIVPWLAPYLRVTVDSLFPGAFRPSTSVENRPDSSGHIS